MDYDFDAKRQYRDRIVASVDGMLRKPKWLRTVAYLDTKQALETKRWLAEGYNPKNLYAINRSPSEVATLTRRLDSESLPRVNTLGLHFLDALERVGCQFDVINFDGTAQVGIKRGLATGDLNGLARFVVAGGVLCVTVLAAREHKNDSARVNFGAPAFRSRPQSFRTSFGAGANPSHVRRLQWVARMVTGYNDDALYCVGHAVKLKWDVYNSASRQPMMWCAVQIARHRVITNDERRIFDSVGVMPACAIANFANAIANGDVRVVREATL